MKPTKKASPAVIKKQAEPVPIPRFYFPLGQPLSANEIEGQVQRLATVFTEFDEGKAKKEDFSKIAKVGKLYRLYV